MRRRFRQRKLNYWLLLAVIILLGFITAATMMFIKASRPMTQARAEAVKIAKKQAHLKTVDEFYWFNRGKSYFTVTGKNVDDKPIVVIIPKTGDKLRLLSQKDGLTEADVRQLIAERQPQEKIEKLALGIYQKQTVWEVTTKNKNGELNYYLLAFSNGKKVKTIKNL
ncbi:cell wall elongation regulator TseB-like domain-containing protein [Enterococcus sp. CSURQ0835]|uniref:cell wall elongation regulator TseB-like domain-containing protein n=1 Tax=Enterococcus sp. CSURQ0835 TaxID=2681394 RepID=UPI001F2886F0|nr:DUF5590 domain-containing protein [Enterococcus sp. CSURQ0835]